MATRNRASSSITRSRYAKEEGSDKPAEQELIPAPALAHLQHHGIMQVTMTKNAADTLAVATKAFQGQLEVCSKQLPGNRYRGYRSFPAKHKLEYQTGAGRDQDLGVLQGLATMVSLRSPPFRMCYFEQAGLTESVLRWLTPWTSLPEGSWCFWQNL